MRAYTRWTNLSSREHSDDPEFSSTEIYGQWCLEVSQYIWIYVRRCRFVHHPCSAQLSARNNAALPAVDVTSSSYTSASKSAMSLRSRGHRRQLYQADNDEVCEPHAIGRAAIATERIDPQIQLAGISQCSSQVPQRWWVCL